MKHIDAAKQSKGSSSNDIYAHVLQKILQVNPNSQTILDVGCGQGNFLKKLKKSFSHSQLCGADLVKYEEFGEEFAFLSQDLNQDFSEEFSRYDLITALEVIEHLENPRKFLRNLVGLLNSEGTLIVSTPNIESFTSLISFFIRGYHSAFGPRDYPAHITPISLYDFKNMVNELEGVKIEAECYIPNGRIPGTGVMWKSIFPFLRGKRFSDNYFLMIRKI